MSEFKEVNYLAEARSRVTEQFKEAPVFDKYLQLLISDTEELQVMYRDLLEKRSLETATGAQLDIIGRIVGQERELIDVNILEFFGFIGVVNAGPMGDYYNPELGAIFFSLGDKTVGNILLNDDLYRILIKAKIAKNVTNATPEDIMRLTNFIFNTSGSTVEDEGGASYRLWIGRILNRFERGLLQYVRSTPQYRHGFLAKPIGVGVRYGQFNYPAFFAFAGVPNAKGFGSLVYNEYNGEYAHNGEIKYGPVLGEEGGVFASLLDLSNLQG